MSKIQNANIYCKECGGKVNHEVFLPGRKNIFLSDHGYYCEDCGKEYDFKEKVVGYIDK